MPDLSLRLYIFQLFFYAWALWNNEYLPALRERHLQDRISILANIGHLMQLSVKAYFDILHCGIRLFPCRVFKQSPNLCDQVA